MPCRLTVATSCTSSRAAMVGTCWSRAILPIPTRAIRNASGCFIETFVLVGGGKRRKHLLTHTAWATLQRDAGSPRDGAV
ncbi:exported hypothetical protein [Xanthomonas citri pv. fuscans]|nr:exported hypothetical protein [Xanthomonas citri pv. fuscans]